MSKNDKTDAKAKKPVVTLTNPFGKAEVVKDPLEILQGSFGIGIANYDRGADVWDNDRVDEQGKPSPGWVHQPNESLECVIMFSVNEGKGTGRQVIPADEFVDYVTSLQSIIDSNYAEPEGADRTEYIPTNVVAAQSFKLVRPKKTTIGTDGKTKSTEDTDAPRDVVSVRCTSGKGAKPMLVAKDRFPAVVAALIQVADHLPEYEEQAWTNYEAKQETVSADPAADVTTTSE